MIDFPYPNLDNVNWQKFSLDVYDVNLVFEYNCIYYCIDDPLADSRSQSRGLDPLIGHGFVSLSTTLIIID